MSAHLALPTATLLITAALLGYVLMQRARSTFFGGIVAALVAILAWVGGLILGSTAPPQSGWASLGLLIHLAGICSVASAFALVSMRFARVSAIEQNPAAVVVALCIPGALCLAMIASNPLHGQFGRALDGTFFSQATAAWRGPLYWVMVGWVYAASGFGLLLCLRRALQTPDSAERRRLVLISMGASTPLIGYAAQNLGWIPVPPEVPVATLCLTASALIMAAGVMRFGFLDTSLLPLRDVIEHLGDGLILADLEGSVVEANPAAASLIGRPGREVVGMRLREVLRDLGDDGTIHRALLNPEIDRRATHRLEISGGRILEVRCGWLRGRRRGGIGCFAVLSDRTEELHHQQLRHRTQRLESLGVLVGGLAHEINNPLAYVRANLGHLAEMADQLGDPNRKDDATSSETFAEMRETVEDSLEGLERIATVVASTRKLAPREGRRVLELVDVNALVEECLALALRYAGTQTRPSADLASDLPPIVGMADRLRQVLLNLLVNACQASPGGRVHTSTRACGDELEICVEDDGPGIDVALRDRIFDPFFTTKSPDMGMGLGLSIVHDIVREHDGEIELGESPLGGTCFRVVLPSRNPLDEADLSVSRQREEPLDAS